MNNRDFFTLPHQAGGRTARDYGLGYPFNAERTESIGKSVFSVVIGLVGVVLFAALLLAVKL